MVNAQREGSGAGVPLKDGSKLAELSAEMLTRCRCGGRSQLGVGRGPDAFDVVARDNEKRGRSKRHKRDQQRVLDQILTGVLR